MEKTWRFFTKNGETITGYGTASDAAIYFRWLNRDSEEILYQFVEDSSVSSIDVKLAEFITEGKIPDLSIDTNLAESHNFDAAIAALNISKYTNGNKS